MRKRKQMHFEVGVLEYVYPFVYSVIRPVNKRAVVCKAMSRGPPDAGSLSPASPSGDKNTNVSGCRQRSLGVEDHRASSSAGHVVISRNRCLARDLSGCSSRHPALLSGPPCCLAVISNSLVASAPFSQESFTGASSAPGPGTLSRIRI